MAHVKFTMIRKQRVMAKGHKRGKRPRRTKLSVSLGMQLIIMTLDGRCQKIYHQGPVLAKVLTEKVL